MPDDVNQTFGEWLHAEMDRLNINKQTLADKSGVTYVGIWNILNGNTRSPRQDTRRKLSEALNVSIPDPVEKEIVQEQNEIPGYEWFDFAPEDLEAIPECGGVYVFYDVTERPVYVGKSKNNVRLRIKDHRTRFWFKAPLVVRGAFLAVDDAEMCGKLEKY